MIKVIFGNKGIGKTKYLIENANGMLNDCTGDVVFVNHNNSLMTDLRHEIRYVDISEFPISRLDEIFAFICGLIAEDFDIKAIFLDGLERYSASHNECFDFFERLKSVSDKYEIKCIFSVNGDISGVPDYVIKEYSC